LLYSSNCPAQECDCTVSETN